MTEAERIAGQLDWWVNETEFPVSNVGLCAKSAALIRSQENELRELRIAQKVNSATNFELITKLKNQAAEIVSLETTIERLRDDAERWRYTQQKNYFRCGPTTSYGDWIGYVVGVQKKGRSVNQSVQGRGDTLQEAIDAARAALETKVL